MRNTVGVILLILCVSVHAEMPNNITDPKTQEVLEYLDTKLNSTTKRLNTIAGGTGGIVVSIASGGTGATTAAGARGNLLVPSTTGTGASGTWGINITGNAATGTDSSKVAKTGDTMTGALTNDSGFVGPLTGAASLNVLKTGGTMTGGLVMANNSTITVTGNSFSVDGGTFVVKDGYVGIGTNTPTNTLDVYGNLDIYGDIWVWDGDHNVDIWSTGLDIYNNAATRHIKIAEEANSFFDTGYNLGIGIKVPTYKFDVTGGGHFTSSMTVDGGYYGDGSTLTGVVKTAGDTMTGVLIVSTSATSTDSMCFVGAVVSLPTTGYDRGCLAYLVSDPTSLYISTETVVSANSWLAK